jgi:hypothetical protein
LVLIRSLCTIADLQLVYVQTREQTETYTMHYQPLHKRHNLLAANASRKTTMFGLLKKHTPVPATNEHASDVMPRLIHFIEIDLLRNKFIEKC